MTQSDRQRASGARRRRTRRGTSLSRAAYVDAAVHLIERRGAATVTARSLAAVVGADPSALYRYFTGVDEILRAAADHMIGIALDRWTRSEDWLESLAGLARAIFGVYAREFPRTGLTVAPRATGLPNEIRVVELTLGLLSEGGFDGESAAFWFRSLSDFLLGQAMLESASAQLPEPVRAGDEEAWRSLATRLPGAETPHSAAVADQLGALMSESSFDATLELILRGLAASPRRLG